MLLAAFASRQATAQPPTDQPLTAYVGTYTQPGKSQGIYKLTFDPVTGTASLQGLAAKAENPSFVALRPLGPPPLCRGRGQHV